MSMTPRMREDVLASAGFFVLLRVGVLILGETAGWEIVPHERPLLWADSRAAGIGIIIGALTALLRLPFSTSTRNIAYGVALGSLIHVATYPLFIYGRFLLSASMNPQLLALGVESVLAALLVSSIGQYFRAHFLVRRSRPMSGRS